jgi:hypothetical protein
MVEQLLVSNQTVFLVWTVLSPQQVDIRRSLDSGLSFEQPIEISEHGSADVRLPAAALSSNGSIYLLWLVEDRASNIGTSYLIFSKFPQSNEVENQNVLGTNETNPSLPLLMGLSAVSAVIIAYFTLRKIRMDWGQRGTKAST